MILLTNRIPTERDKAVLSEYIKNFKVKEEYVRAGEQSFVSLEGETFMLDENVLRSFSFVEKVFETDEPFHLVSRKYKKDNTVVEVGKNDKVKIGSGDFTFIAGPCAVESYEQMIGLAKSLKKAGVKMLRGGAFKPRTSPYAFQGLNEEGIELLVEAKKQTGLSVISEVPGENALKYFDDIDVLQIGARNMQNYSLLREIGGLRKPVLLKRGMSATVKEWLLSAEYLMKYGNENVILCERGIKTFDVETRGTLDFAAVSVLKEKTHLPVIIDPSNSSGNSKFVTPSVLSAACFGADGVIVEVSDNPEGALCDGMQAISSEEMADTIAKTNKILACIR